MRGFNRTMLGVIFGASMSLSIFPTAADVDISKFPLGMSPKTLHDKLVAETFVFKRFSQKRVTAIKRTATRSSAGTEFTELHESTKITANVCAGKVFRIEMQSIYGSNQSALLFGRKSIYKYLKDNNAVNDNINYHKNPNNPGVVLSFNIDRNNQANKEIRGTEVVKLSLGESPSISRSVEPKKILQMKYRLENRWFCPN